MTTPDGQWVPAIVLGGQVTPEQRERNFDLYKRLRDGVPEAERQGLRGGPLHQFVFDVPADIVSFGPVSAAAPKGSLSFRLRPDDECFRRLLSCISDSFPLSCEADEEVKRLRVERDEWERRAIALGYTATGGA